MKPERSRFGPLLAALALLLYHALLHAPQIARGDLYLPVALDAIPPWYVLGEDPERPQDRAGTDKVVYTLPNLAHWKWALENDPGAILWDPTTLCGTPWLAAQATGALYPGNFLVFLLPIEESFLWSALLHGWLASFLAFLVLVRVPVSTGAALIGAAVWGGSGWFVGHTDIPHFIQAWTWIPLMVLGADIAVADRRWRGVAMLALGVMLSFFGGMAQITLIGLLLAGLLTLTRALSDLRLAGPKATLHGGALALAGLVLGLGLAAPQLLPTLEVAEESGRYRQDLEALRGGALGAGELLSLLAPGILGSAPELDLWHGGETPRMKPPQSEAGFPLARLAGTGAHGASLLERIFSPGVVGLLLALIALLSRRRRALLLGLGLLTLGLGAAMGTPLLDLLHHLPGFDLGSPRRLLVFAVAGFALLAALGFDRATEGLARAPLVVLSSLPLLPLAVAALAGGLAGEAVSEAVAERLGDAAAVEGLGAWIAAAAAPPLFAGLAALLALIFLAARPRLLATALLVALTCEMGWLDQRINPGQPAGASLTEHALTRHLAERLALEPGAPARAAGGYRFLRFRDPAEASQLPTPLPPNLGRLFRLRDAQGYDGLVLRRTQEFFGLIDPAMPQESARIGPVTMREALASQLLDIAGVRCVVGTAIAPLEVIRSQDGAGGVRLIGAPEDSSLDPKSPVAVTVVQERPSALPLLQLVSEVRTAMDDAQALRIRRARPSPEVCVVTRYPGESWPEFSPETSSIELLSATATEIRLRARCQEESLLRIAQAWHPAWRADRADGISMSLFRVDHAFQGVLLPQGECEVILSFDSHRFFLGQVLAAASLLILLILAPVLWLQRRKAAS